jgi:hypothetical protein
MKMLVVLLLLAISASAIAQGDGVVIGELLSRTKPELVTMFCDDPKSPAIGVFGDSAADCKTGFGEQLDYCFDYLFGALPAERSISSEQGNAVMMMVADCSFNREYGGIDWERFQLVNELRNGGVRQLNAYRQAFGNQVAVEPSSPAAQYLSLPEVRSRYARYAAYWEIQLGVNSDCNSSMSTGNQEFWFYEDLKFVKGKTHPVSGMWLTRFDLNRCDTAQTYSFVAIAQDNEPPRLVPMYPGDSTVTPLLYLDMSNVIAAGSVGALEMPEGALPCMSYSIANTRIVASETAAKEQVREELWTLEGCDSKGDLLIEFSSDGAGGTNFATRIP